MLQTVVGVLLVQLMIPAAHGYTPDRFEPLFTQLGVGDGLSQTTVNDLMQDRKGYIWIGTQDGLNRFDGYQFLVYRNTPDDDATLSHNWVWQMLEDRSGVLWVATWNGLNRLDPESGAFIRYNGTDTGRGGIGNDRTNLLFEDSGGNLWVGTWGSGLYRYSKSEDGFVDCAGDFNPSGPGSGLIRCLHEDAQGRLWVGTFGGGLFRKDPGADGFLHQDLPLRNGRITDLASDRQGNIWAGTYDEGIFLLSDGDRPGLRISDFSATLADSEKSIRQILCDRQGRIWIGTRNSGLLIREPGAEGFIRVRHKPSDPRSLAGDEITELYEDVSGTIWVGTRGISLYDARRLKFMHYKHLQNDPNSLSADIVRSIFSDGEGRIWIGSDGGGLNFFNPDSRAFRQYGLGDRPGYRLTDPDVRCISAGRNGSLWLGTFGGGLHRFEPSNGKIQSFYQRSDYPEGAMSIQHLLSRRDGTLLIGSVRDGIYVYDAATDRFTRFSITPNDTAEVTSSYINYMLEEPDGSLWIGGWGGGLVYCPRDSACGIRYLHDPKRPGSLSNDIVYCIHRDRKGRLWIGTAGGLNLLVKEKSRGFNRFDETFEHHYTRDGLPNDVIYGILEDDQGYLWISTNRGLSRFDPEEERFVNYTSDDGLQSEEFNANAFHKTSDGRLLFGGIHGFNIFNPEKLPSNDFLPPVVITGIHVHNRQVHHPEGQPIVLRHHQNSVTFEYAGLSYLSSRKNQYAYRMEGLEEEWIQAGTRRIVTYANLQPGRFRFRVIAANSDGLWNLEGTAVDLVLRPPFWRTYWFTAMVAALLIAVLYLLYRLRIQQILRIEKLRIRIAGDLHDDVGSNLTKISIYSDLARSLENADEKLQQIAETSRNTVQLMSDIVWSIDRRYDRLGDVVERMKDFALSVLSPLNVTLYFDAAELPNDRRLDPDIRQSLYLIFKEAVNNAARHSGATEVRVSLRHRGRMLEMCVSDNGKGIGSTDKKQGNGLANMRRRAGAIRAELHISGIGGTTITLTIRSI